MCHELSDLLSDVRFGIVEIRPRSNSRKVRFSSNQSRLNQIRSRSDSPDVGLAQASVSSKPDSPKQDLRILLDHSDEGHRMTRLFGAIAKVHAQNVCWHSFWISACKWNYIMQISPKIAFLYQLWKTSTSSVSLSAARIEMQIFIISSWNAREEKMHCFTA